ncbi:K02A2.6-like [Cordylochernes scorpioides]|uniref:K02A2.6-like n=1 Tax=Cordylochernes scorpioides TaxID=51811 RepID=A0ABY6LBR7_9ARAC|nr:K02A2.6-like [Cordylochernes scorpioides]
MEISSRYFFIYGCQTQFEVVALGNRWSSSEKGINLAASLRGSATEVLQSLLLEQRLDYEYLVYALTLRFGEARRDSGRVGSRYLLAHHNFVDAIEDPECQQSVRMSEAKTLQETLMHALKFEAARSNELATEGLVNGVPCRMVIDSSANVTFSVLIYLREWGQSQSEFQLVLKFQIRNNLFSHLVYLADIKDDCHIGLDVVRKFGFSIDFQENVLKVAGEEIPLVGSRSSVTNKGLKIQQKKLKRLLFPYEDVFATSPNDVGRTNVTQHRIDTGGAAPVKQLPRRLPMTRIDEVDKLIEEMAEQDVIEPSSSLWASPVVLVKKKNGSTRFCVDYRRLNDLTKKDSYPLPRIDATLDTLSRSQWFSTLDLKSGYWQVRIHLEDREKTAFTAGNGLWQFKVMPFGLCNAPATFERLMETVLQGIPLETCLVYLDDIIVMGKSFEENLINLERVLQKIRGARLKAMDKLKQTLSSPSMLAYPDQGEQFILDTDASNTGIGDVLYQTQD